MKKSVLVLIPIMIISFVLFGCGGDNNTSKSSDGDKVQVEVSISPLVEFVEKIGKDKVEVSCLVPDNVEPHEYELKTRDFQNISEKKLFIYNGLGMESWLDKVKEQIPDDSKVKLIDTSKEVDIRKEDGKEDPHTWLSLVEASNQCISIRDALIEIDPDNKEYYETNYNEFKKSLDDLYNEYKPKFEALSNKSFITSHEAFGYLCRDYNLEQRYLNDMFGEGEPTPKKYEELAKYCKDNKINTIFSEGSDSTKEADTLAKEIDGKVQPINTLETKVDGKTYIEVMRYNYDSILASLK